MNAPRDPKAARYARQVTFKKIGLEGQEKLLDARVALIGAGALGASVAEQLVRSGVGHVVIVDRDVVEESNLGRQSLYVEADAAARLPKAVALRQHLLAFNPTVDVVARVADVRADTIDDLLEEPDLVIDGTDNFATRYLLNDWCVREDVPWIYGGCVGARGLSAVIIPGETPCLRCLFRDPPPPGSVETCETTGIIAPAATMIAALEVAEALKLLVGDARSVRRGYISVDLWPFRVASVGSESKPDADCPTCGRRQFVFLEGGARDRVVTYCGRDAVQVIPAGRRTVNLASLCERLADVGDVSTNGFALTLRVPQHEITVFDDGRALIRGTRDPAHARVLYDRYVGS